MAFANAVQNAEEHVKRASLLLLSSRVFLYDDKTRPQTSLKTEDKPSGRAQRRTLNKNLKFEYSYPVFARAEPAEGSSVSSKVTYLASLFLFFVLNSVFTHNIWKYVVFSLVTELFLKRESSILFFLNQ